MSANCFLWIGVVFSSVMISSSHLNLYLSTEETYRLLGVHYELYYVRNGVINQYALSFHLPLQSHVDVIYFTWQSLRSQPQIFYRMSFNVSNVRAMLPPSTNISTSGQVPQDTSVFAVRLPCTGQTSAEVHISIHLNISLVSAASPIMLHFRRKKVCLKKNSAQETVDTSVWRPANVDLINHLGFNQTSSSSDVSRLGADAGGRETLTTSSHIFYAAVASTCAGILLLALGVVVYYLRTQPRHQSSSKTSCYDSRTSQALTPGQAHISIRPNTLNNGRISEMPSTNPFGASPGAELEPTDFETILSSLQIEWKRIVLGDVLMEGNFSRVYGGTLLGKDSEDQFDEQDIFVKTVTGCPDQASPQQVQMLLHESARLKGFVHPNVHILIGVCLENPLQPLVVYPYLPEGNLKTFLLKCSLSDGGSRYTVSNRQLIYMAVQIVRGVQFLHRKKLIHKDIAARNCIVGAELVVKVTDSSLSKDLFPGDYACVGDDDNLPVKWMSLEGLLHRRFSPASDVWSYGVTLWEMMTLGQQPYADVDPYEIITYLQQGYRIAKPHSCSDELFSMMACCWSVVPDDRPKLSQIQNYLQNLYLTLGRYV